MRNRTKLNIILVSLVVQLSMLTSLVMAGPQDYQSRPIPMGVSISTTPTLPYIAAGTAGMRVKSLFTPDVKFILSNNHIIGAIGPTLCPDTAPAGTWILQPGTLDIGNDPGKDPHYFVGINIFSVPIDFSPGANNIVDAAIAYTTPDLSDNTILDIGLPSPQFGYALPGMAVTKSGRTTGVTSGVVESINTTVYVNYGADCGTARFIKQVLVTPGTFSAGGDSGSAVLESETNKPVGLLFAGSNAHTIMNQILYVYLSLGVFVD